MKQLLAKRKNVMLLFACGFLIGICLEIILIERGKMKLIPEQGFLEEGVSITCLVLLKHKHMRYVNSSRKTWLKHCNDYSIINVKRSQKPRKAFSRTEDPLTRGVGEVLEENDTCVKNEDVREIWANSAWSGLCKALRVVRAKSCQWVVIVPDSLVVLVENLKLFVRNFNCDDDHYYGYALRNYEADYNVLSAGVLLSQGALKKLLDKFDSDEDCDFSGKYWRNEDLYLGKYLKEFNILPKDTRDEMGRGRFHGYNMNNILWPGKLFVHSDYTKKALFPVSQGFNCCSPHLITVDVSDPDSMYNLYFFFYKLTTVHKEMPKPALPKKVEGFFWKDFLREEGYNETAIENMTDEEYYKIWEKKLPSEVMYQEMRDFMKNHKGELD